MIYLILEECELSGYVCRVVDEGHLPTLCEQLLAGDIVHKGGVIAG